MLKAQTDTVIAYTEVVNVDGVKKGELFTRGRQWFNETFKSSKDVLQISDKETGELSGKGIIPMLLEFKYIVNHKDIWNAYSNVNLWARDGKYKYEISNFEICFQGTCMRMLTSSKEYGSRFAGYPEKKSTDIWNAAKKSLDEQVQILIITLKSKMAKKADNDF